VSRSILQQERDHGFDIGYRMGCDGEAQRSQCTYDEALEKGRVQAKREDRFKFRLGMLVGGMISAVLFLAVTLAGMS